jgi:hypothetical protein
MKTLDRTAEAAAMPRGRMATTATSRAMPGTLEGTPHKAPWLAPHHASRLRRHWQTGPVRLTGAATSGAWPGSDRLMRWMQSDRLSSTHARLWRAPARANALCMPIDARGWTHDRRLGDQVRAGLLQADAVMHELGQGGWLHAQQLHRLDADLSALMSQWQDALGMPLRAHAWRGQCRPLGPGGPAMLNTRMALSAADAAQARFLIVVEGELSVSWLAPSSSSDGQADDSEDDDLLPTHHSSSEKRRCLQAKAGDVLYLPAAESLRWNTRGAVWAIELHLTPLTPLDALAELGAAAMQPFVDDVALRRCSRSMSPLEQTWEADEAVALIQSMNESLRTGAGHDAVLRHRTRVDESTVQSLGRLTNLSKLLGADARTRLRGHPDRIVDRIQTDAGITLRLARKELHFGPQARELLTFVLQAEPYCLADAPQKFSEKERIGFAKKLASEGLVGVA